MAEKTQTKTEALPDLDDLLQCPVCYEIPSGQIFQCNEGHHVCGRCKVRLEVCPVCRALFFGTRNYAMEELIANIKKLRAFKLGGKVTTGPCEPETSTPPGEQTEVEAEEGTSTPVLGDIRVRAPEACKGLFRCMCCKGVPERLPSARLLNHLRYFHAPDLIEGRSENGEYVQAWQFATLPGRIVTAVRVSDMGIFFLIIEINNDEVCAWLTVAATPWIANEFAYTVTISGNDREATFSDVVWSVRSCEGTLKKRGHCLKVSGADARALTAPTAINSKLTLRRAPNDGQVAPPRAVLRVANRGAPPNARLNSFFEDLQNDVARLSLAFESLDRNSQYLLRTENHLQNQLSRIEGEARALQPSSNSTEQNNHINQSQNDASAQVEAAPVVAQMSRSARRRMRQRLRAALNAQDQPASPPRNNQPVPPPQRNNQPVPPPQRNNQPVVPPPQRNNQPVPPPQRNNQPLVPPPQRNNQPVPPPQRNNQPVPPPHMAISAFVQPPPPRNQPIPPQSIQRNPQTPAAQVHSHGNQAAGLASQSVTSGPSIGQTSQPQNRANKKKKRQRR